MSTTKQLFPQAMVDLQPLVPNFENRDKVCSCFIVVIGGFDLIPSIETPPPSFEVGFSKNYKISLLCKMMLLLLHYSPSLQYTHV